MAKHVRILLIAAAMLLLPAAAGAQTLANYFRAYSTDWSDWSGKWIDIPHTNDLLAAGSGGSGSADFRVSTVQNIGFSFPFSNTLYTQFSVNADGNLRLGSTVTGTGNYSRPFNSSSYSYYAPKINFFGCDGYWDSTMHYVCAKDTTDKMGDRLLVVEFCLGTFTSA